MSKNAEEPLFNSDGVGKDKRWSFEHVVSRLKSIQKIENLIHGQVVKTNISEPDDEQNKILDLLEIKLV